MHQHEADQAGGPIVIRLDIGATNSTDAAFALDGRAVPSASVPTITHTPRPGSALDQPAELW